MLRKTLLLCFFMQFFPITALYAANLPSLDCTLSDAVSSDDEIGDAKSSFNTDVGKLYLYCTSDEVKKGQVLKGEWIAVDTNNVAPPNYTIDAASVTVDKNLSSSEEYTARFSISKPNKGWPKGTYVVKVYVDDQLDQSVNFSVK